MPEHAVDDPDGAHDAAVLVVVGVEDERPQRCLRVTLRRRDPLHDGVEEVGDPLPGLGGDAEDIVGGDPEHLLYLAGVGFGLGRRQVDLVEGGHDLEVVLDGEVAVGERLSLDALGGVDEQHDALAGGERAAHLVAEVDVAGGVDQVKDMVPPVHPDVLGLDRDPALPLDVHRVEVLLAHVARVDRAGHLQDAVGERRLSVVDVADDGEVADSARSGSLGSCHGHERAGVRGGIMEWAPSCHLDPGRAAPAAAERRQTRCYDARRRVAMF